MGGGTPPRLYIASDPPAFIGLNLKSLNSGIPFAAAPVKNLRFMPPVTVSPWKEVLDTNQFQPVCPQVNQFQPILFNFNQF